MAETSKKQEDPKPKQPDGDIPPKQTASPSVVTGGGGGRPSSSNTVSPSDTPKRTHRSSGPRSAPAGLRSADHSPLHPHYKDKTAGGRGNGLSTPLWERRSSDGLGPSTTPTRSKLKPAKGTETPDKSASVPKFGDWSESDPSSADGYTQLFNRLREERQGGPGNNMPDAGTDDRLPVGRNRKEQSCCGCFPRGGK